MQSNRNSNNVLRRFLTRLHYGIFYTQSLSRLQRKEYRIAINKENLFRSLLFLAISIILQIIALCVLPFLFVKSKYIVLISAATLFELLLFIFIVVFFSNQKRITSFQWINLGLWVIASVLMQLIIHFEITYSQTIYSFILFVLCYSVFPLLTLSEIAGLTLINILFSCYHTFTHTNSFILILFIILFGMIGFLISQRTISMFYKMLKTNHELILLSETDSLTKLLNRRGIRNKIDVLWSECITYQKNVAIIMIDIDDFKLYNDTYGHGKGDECLELISQSIHWNVNPYVGIVGRYGGEELLVVVENIKDEDVIPLAQRIRKSVQKLNLKSGTGATHPFVTISLGIYTITPTEESKFSDAIKISDQQLYLAKNHGRNCIAYHDFIYK